MDNFTNEVITFAKKRKSFELDVIKYLDGIVDTFNQDPTNHYKLKLLKGYGGLGILDFI